MKIGIKYCGGCNPTYDRTKLVKEIINKYSDIDFEPVNEESVYDGVLIISGCKSACADHESINSGKKIFMDKAEDIVCLNKIFEDIKSQNM